MFVAVQGGMVATNDGDGIRAVATAGLNLTITGTSIVNNFGTAVLASGAAATVRIGGATILGNTTGVSFAGATMQSFKNNQIARNHTDGTPIPPFSGPGGTALQSRSKVSPIGLRAKRSQIRSPQCSARVAHPWPRPRTWSAFSRSSLCLSGGGEGLQLSIVI